ncbi:MAG: response regulator, partial [Thermodesulfobacteriota bacterium]|nr:response regulator [Thermodesulfobacteriota bacterium]
MIRKSCPKETLAKRFRGVGYAVETSHDPREALDKIGQSKYDFILTDIKMPHMDGMTLAKEAQKTDPDLAVLFMTGYASLDTAKEAIKAGAYDYIMKPFELSELRKAVAKAVAKKAKIEESSGGQDLKRLSDLMEVLYNVGDRDSLLKLSLGLALLNCGLEIGMIAAWDQRSSNLELAATNNVKAGAFDVVLHELKAEEAETCFSMKSPLRSTGIADNTFFNEISKRVQ